MEEVQTVLGPLPAEKLGVTMAHEHLFVDVTVNWVAPREPSLLPVAEGPVTIEVLGLLRRNPALSRDTASSTTLRLLPSRPPSSGGSAAGQSSTSRIRISGAMRPRLPTFPGRPGSM